MLRLALLALALLATVPTLGRIASVRTALQVQAVAPASPDHRLRQEPAPLPAAHAHPHHAGGPPTAVRHHPAAHGDAMSAAPHHGHAARADADHMPAVPVAATHEHLPTGNTGGEPHAGHQGDCDYCPLLRSLLGAFAVVLLTTPATDLPAPRFHAVVAILPWQYPTGLGSRGPPATL